MPRNCPLCDVAIEAVCISVRFPAPAASEILRPLVAMPKGAERMRQPPLDQAGRIRTDENQPPQLIWLLDTVAREFEGQSGNANDQLQADMQKGLH